MDVPIPTRTDPGKNIDSVSIKIEVPLGGKIHTDSVRNTSVPIEIDIKRLPCKGGKFLPCPKAKIFKGTIALEFPEG